jgi:ribonuclease HI
MNPASKKLLQLFTDGACRGNPGPGAAGAVLLGENDEILHEWHRFLGHCTNNIAEYEALILGITNCLEKGYTRLAICLDSELLVRQITGQYRVKNPHLQRLMASLRALLAGLEYYEIRHVPRSLNHRADGLANLALDNFSQIR